VASLQARHTRSCALRRPWTTFEAAAKGCTCTPLYHVVHRTDGKLVRDPVGHNRKEARRALDDRRGAIARREFRVLDDVAFDRWADRWLTGFTGKESSRRAYKFTLDYARPIFARKNVRDLRASDVRRFLEHIRAENERRTP
jgi:hypothetical protein